MFRRERNITVRLSDEECKQLYDLCGRRECSVNELLEILIWENTDKWLERLNIEWYDSPTLLQHLLFCGYEPEDYLDILDKIETAKNDKKYLEEHPEEADEEEASCIDDNIAAWEQELKDMRAGWTIEHIEDWEIENIKIWSKKRKEFLTQMKRQIEEELLLNVTAYILADNPSEELREKCKKGLLAEINRIATNQLYKDYATGKSQEEREKALRKWYEAKGIPEPFRMI